MFNQYSIHANMPKKSNIISNPSFIQFIRGTYKTGPMGPEVAEVVSELVSDAKIGTRGLQTPLRII